MEQKALYHLTIDSSFSTLIHPLSQDELLHLEENLLRDGCIDPIVVWDNVIIDGHNRYRLCTKHAIPFAIEKKSFSCRQEAISWICANQLGRRNISAETRKYLIGKQYEAEKIINRLKNKAGNNQFQIKEQRPVDGTGGQLPPSSGHITARRIGAQHNVSQRTVERCGAFVRAIERVQKTEPGLVPEILSGKRKIPQKKLSSFAREGSSPAGKPAAQSGQLPAGSKKTAAGCSSAPAKPSVKDMPKHDPDGEARSLSLTVPSWKESIEHVITVADMEAVSAIAKQKMRNALLELISSAEALLKIISNAER